MFVEMSDVCCKSYFLACFSLIFLILLVCLYILSVGLFICLSVSQFTSVQQCEAVLFAVLSICLSVRFCTLLCPLFCIWCQPQSCMLVCLQSLGTKGALHPLSILQNNEPVPQVLFPVKRKIFTSWDRL